MGEHANRPTPEDRPVLTRRHLLQGAAAAGVSVVALPSGLGVALGAAPTAMATTSCFKKADNDRLQGLRVLQWARPPANDTEDATYAFWPCTDAASQQNISTSTWSGNKWHNVWANRDINGTNRRANVVRAPIIRHSNGLECRAIYTTVAKANAATQSFIRYTLGMANHAEPWVAAGGTAGDFVGFDALAADPDAHFTTLYTVGNEDWQVIVDVPWTPQFRLADTAPQAPGIWLDYEVADNRGEAAATAFIQAVATDLHSVGKQLYLYTNPLNTATVEDSGLTANNLPGLSKNHIDFLALTLGAQSKEGDIRASYDNQIAQLEEFGLVADVSWEFEVDGDAEGWAPTAQLTPFVVAGGVLSTSSTGTTPTMRQTEPLSIDASGGVVVEIVMQASISSSGWVNWATADDPLFSRARSTDFTVLGGGMQTYRVHIPPQASAMTRLQIIPVRAEGDIGIDAIRVFKKVPVPGATVDYTRLAITFELGTNPGTTIEDAHTVHGILTDPVNPHPTHVNFWRNLAVQGGACGSLTNDKISIVCFGST